MASSSISCSSVKAESHVQSDQGNYTLSWMEIKDLADDFPFPVDLEHRRTFAAFD
jgi:hypothetical protein